MTEVYNKLKEVFDDVTERDCCGVYDKIVRVKYGIDPHDLGWVYLKENKIILMHIKNDNYDTLESFIEKLKEIKN